MDLVDLKKQMPDIFEKVKQDVETVLRQHRAGLTLGLVEMGVSPGGFIGGMFFSGGTMIIMNVTALRLLVMEKHESEEILINYVYHILLHEYIHSLGVLNERKCRQLTFYVTQEIFKDEKHPASIMASRGISAYFPEIIYAPINYQPNAPLRIEMVRDFDKSSTMYYS